MGRPPGSRNKTTKDQKPPKKPRKTKAKAAPAASSQSSAETLSNSKKPTADQVVWLVNELEMIDNKKGLFSESAKEIVDNAVETKHFDKPALAMARKLYKMAQKEPEKFAVTFPHLLAYCEDLGLDYIANDARGLPLGDEPPHITTADVAILHSDAA